MGTQEASACPWLHCSPSPKPDPKPQPLTVGSVWTETISSGLTSCGSSEGGARPGSFCLEGKECTRQSPPQPVCGSAGSQKGPYCRVLTPQRQPCAPVASALSEGRMRSQGYPVGGCAGVLSGPARLSGPQSSPSLSQLSRTLVFHAPFFTILGSHSEGSLTTLPPPRHRLVGRGQPTEAAQPGLGRWAGQHSYQDS